MFSLHPQLAKDTLNIGESKLCQFLLMNNRELPWLILVPKRTGIHEIYELNKADQSHLTEESAVAGQVLMREFGGHKLNIAALGNVVPQLHVHHVVRFRHDPAWPAPVWGSLPNRPYTQSQAKQMLKQLRELFIASDLEFQTFVS